MPNSHELNLDGLVGPTHNYAGLAWGNLASVAHGQQESRPRDAALQGLAKMKMLADLGVKQAVLPPQERPDIGALRRLGFAGSDAQVLDAAARQDSHVLHACAGASAMWAANAATVSPSPDSGDGRVHFTPANLARQFHRAIETAATAAALRAIFPDESAFTHHAPVPGGQLGDEGAANHLRLCTSYDQPGMNVFAYGRTALAAGPTAPTRYPPRQAFEASQAVARLHGLAADRTLFLQQNPSAIDAGAFHTDVVAVANCNVLLIHGSAFIDSRTVHARLRRQFTDVCGGELQVIEAAEEDLPLTDAVASYLFNSQLVTLPSGRMTLIAPTECLSNPRAHRFIDRLIEMNTPIASVSFVDVRQSMNNGGGPACLRLRVVLTDAELAKMNQGVILTNALYAELVAWINRHYRATLRPADLADPRLLDEGRAALDELTRILHLGSIYPFQRAKGKCAVATDGDR